MASQTNQWAPPPAFTPAPTDAQLTQRIALLAKFAAQNGPAFIETVKEKQAGNADYNFLFGGPGADYFRWALHCATTGQPVDVCPPPPVPVLPPVPPLPSEVADGFRQVLEALNGSKESIKAGQQWFMACDPLLAPGLAVAAAARLSQLPTFEQQLHVLYLVNDVLFKGCVALTWTWREQGT